PPNPYFWGPPTHGACDLPHTQRHDPLVESPRRAIPAAIGSDSMQHLPSVRHLRHLMALADPGHFCRAAEACCVTQSTLSASIKELENVLEATLRDRTKRNVVLTPLGLATLERARKTIVDF